MVLVVPFDGSDLSKAALLRAVQFRTVLEEDVVAVSVIPESNAAYARKRGWIDDSEPFDAETVVSHLREAVAELAPDAEFHHVFVDKYAPRGTIAGRLRRFIRRRDTTIVFIGSENAGRIMSTISVGQSVSGGDSYDTFIVSTERPPKIEKLEADLPMDEEWF